MVVLGIETTCDETAAAVVERPDLEAGKIGAGNILSNVVLSQIDAHAAFGGVVPEIAARAHVEAIDLIIAQAMFEARLDFAALDGIAAAAGPGLIGGVIVGLTTAKAIALVTEKPLIAVNHLEAHALTARLTDATAFPYCLFLASGGHTQIVACLTSETMRDLAPRLMMPSARRSTRRQSFSGSAIREARRSREKRKPATPHALRCRVPCWGAPTPTFHSRD